MNNRIIFAIAMIVAVVMVGQASAAVTVTPASGGDTIPTDDFGIGDWTSLGVITISEAVSGDIPTGTIILTLPPGFEYNTAISPSVVVAGTTPELAAEFTSIGATQLTVTVTAASSTETDNDLLIGSTTAIQVRPFDDSQASGDIYMDADSVSAINGVTEGAAGTNFGTLQEEVAGVASAGSLAANPYILFYGQNTTVTWTSSVPDSSYIWVNSNVTWVGDDTHTNLWMYNDIASLPGDINCTEVFSDSGSPPYSFTYTFANWTVNSSVETWKVWVSDAGVDTFDNTLPNTTIYTNAYNATIQTGRSVADGNSTLAGDSVTVCVTTSGIQSPFQRDDLPFSLTLPDNGNDVMSGYVNTAGTGNYTFTINATKAGVGVLRNITLTYGSPANFSWNSTQLAGTACLWGGTTGRLQFDVSQVNLKAYDVPADVAVAAHNITSVNITTLDLGGNLIGANPAYPVNVTLTNSITSASTMSFNWMHPGFVTLNNYTVNLSFVAGDGNIPRTNITGWCNSTYGNYTHPLNTSGAIVASTGTHTITASVNTSGTEWTDTYLIHPDTEKVKLEPPADTSYQIGEYVLITGWNCIPGGTTWVNITGPGTPVVLTNSTAATNNPTDGGFSHNWSTNYTWNTIQGTTWNATFNKTGIYTITAGNATSGDWYDSYTITLSEDITAAPNTTSIPVNGSLWINGTTDRWNSNGTFLHCNISTRSDRTGKFVNGTLSDTISTFNATTGLATYSILWNSADNLLEIVAAAAPVDSSTYNGLYYITVNDSAAKNTAATFHITDTITANPAAGVPGRNFSVTGTSTRGNGTVINVSVQTQSGVSVVGICGDAYVYGNEWNVTLNASLSTGDPLPAVEPYTIVANDSIVKSSSTLTMGTGVINLEVIPDETTMDGIVWFNGTTDLGAGTIIGFNVTNTTGVLIGTTSATVGVDTTFNKSWTVNTSSLIIGNFTAPVEQCTVKAYNGTITTTRPLNITENLVITTSDFEIAPGGEFKIEGTLNRVNGTSVTITTCDTGEIPMLGLSGGTATVYGGEFNLTLSAKYTLGNLPLDVYTITAKDGTNASTSITMTVAAAKVTLDNPADGATCNVNDTISIDGTSNIGNNTNISVTIQRTSGPGAWSVFTTSVYGTTDFAGSWSTVWNTSADSAFQALDTKTGTYVFWAQNGTVSATMHTITIAAELTVDTITIAPVGPLTMNVGEDKTFTATCKNGSTVLTGITVAWASSNTTVGSDPASGVFTADANGTTTITATAQGKTSNAVTVTVGTAAVCPGDVTGDGYVNYDDVLYMVLNLWGSCTSGAEGDVNTDGYVNYDDVLYMVLNLWGACP